MGKNPEFGKFPAPIPVTWKSGSIGETSKPALNRHKSRATPENGQKKPPKPAVNGEAKIGRYRSHSIYSNLHANKPGKLFALTLWNGWPAIPASQPLIAVEPKVFYINAVADAYSPRRPGSRARLYARALVLVLRFTVKTHWNRAVRRLRVLKLAMGTSPSSLI